MRHCSPVGHASVVSIDAWSRLIAEICQHVVPAFTRRRPVLLCWLFISVRPSVRHLARSRPHRKPAAFTEALPGRGTAVASAEDGRMAVGCRGRLMWTDKRGAWRLNNSPVVAPPAASPRLEYASIDWRRDTASAQKNAYLFGRATHYHQYNDVSVTSPSPVDLFAELLPGCSNK